MEVKEDMKLESNARGDRNYSIPTHGFGWQMYAELSARRPETWLHVGSYADHEWIGGFRSEMSYYRLTEHRKSLFSIIWLRHIARRQSHTTSLSGSEYSDDGFGTISGQ